MWFKKFRWRQNYIFGASVLIFCSSWDFAWSGLPFWSCLAFWSAFDSFWAFSPPSWGLDCFAGSSDLGCSWALAWSSFLVFFSDLACCSGFGCWSVVVCFSVSFAAWSFAACFSAAAAFLALCSSFFFSLSLLTLAASFPLTSSTTACFGSGGLY